MSIKFKLLATKGILNRITIEKCNNSNTKIVKVSMNKLTEIISYLYTVIKSCFYMRSISLLNNIITKIEQGHILKLDGMCYFQTDICTTDNKTTIRVDANDISEKRIIFRFCKNTSSVLNDLLDRKFR